jgi:hypothetical protein
VLISVGNFGIALPRAFLEIPTAPMNSLAANHTNLHDFKKTKTTLQCAQIAEAKDT